MASALIHLAVAKELEKRRQSVKNTYDYYLGSIAPDLAKQIGLTRDDSHFVKNSYNDIPNLKLFEYKYPNFRSNDYDLGYYTHLYTDKEWSNNFLTNIITENTIRLLDGTVLECTKEEMLDLLL